ncbi:MAG TPA: hypothetical protein VHB79_36645 [Polyangiaceae bacterium]|nr:hypothetical protein [Polyangiaceae bacterium]
MRPWPLILALASSLTAASAVEAAPAVALAVGESCAGVDRTELARLLRVEQRREVGSELARAAVAVTCEGDVVTLSVERQGDNRARQRTFVPGDVAGEIGARVLSLAAIELLKQENAAEPVRPAEPARPAEPPPPPAPPPPREAAPSVRLMLGGGAQSFAWQTPLKGGGLVVDFLRLSKLGMRLGFDVAVADHEYAAGSAHVQLTTLTAQAGYLALHDAWTARAFLGYRLGAGRISGKAGSGAMVPVGTVAGACGGPLLSAGLGLRSGAWIAELGAEAGLVSFPLEGVVEDHDPITLKSYWLGLSLNVGALL